MKSAQKSTKKSTKKLNKLTLAQRDALRFLAGGYPRFDGTRVSHRSALRALERHGLVRMCGKQLPVMNGPIRWEITPAGLIALKDYDSWKDHDSC